MVKLIKLTGQADAPGSNANKEIQNTFRDNIFVEPNSRLALRSVFVELDQSSTSQVFPVKTSSDSYQYRISGSLSDYVTVSPTIADYPDLSLLLRELQVQANKTLPQDSGTFLRGDYLGLHNAWRKVGNRAQLDVYQAVLDACDFVNDWTISEGDASSLDPLQSNGTFGADGTERVVLQSLFAVPVLASESTFECKNITDGGGNYAEFEWSLIVNDNPSDKLWTVKLTDAGSYQLFVNGSLVGATSDQVAQDNDIVSVKKEGTSVTLTVTYAGGGTESEAGTLNATFAKEQNLSNELTVINTGGVTPLELGNSTGQPCEIMQIESLDSNNLMLGATSSVTIDLDFSGKLGAVLGYTTSSSLVQTGDPASFTSNVQPPGSLINPGIMVCIDGLDLESYSGTQIGGSQSQQGALNILDVIYPVHDRPNEIQYFADFPVPLFMKNQRQINIKDLRLKFVRLNEGQPVIFRGTPTVVLEIYSPGEST